MEAVTSFIARYWPMLAIGGGVLALFVLRPVDDAGDADQPSPLQWPMVLGSAGVGAGQSYAGPSDSGSSAGSELLDQEYQIALRQLDVQELVANNALEQTRLLMAGSMFSEQSQLMQAFLRSDSRNLIGQFSNGFTVNLAQTNWTDRNNIGRQIEVDRSILATFNAASATFGPMLQQQSEVTSNGQPALQMPGLENPALAQPLAYGPSSDNSPGNRISADSGASDGERYFAPFSGVPIA